MKGPIKYPCLPKERFHIWTLSPEIYFLFILSSIHVCLLAPLPIDIVWLCHRECLVIFRKLFIAWILLKIKATISPYHTKSIMHDATQHSYTHSFRVLKSSWRVLKSSLHKHVMNMFVFLVLMLMFMRLCLCLCTSENSIRQISGFVLLLLLMLMSRVFSLAYNVMLVETGHNSSEGSGI